MRVDGTGRVHPTMGDEVTTVGLAHIDNCGECRGDVLPRGDIAGHREMLRVAVNDLVDRVAMNQTAVSPIRGVKVPESWNDDFAGWVPTVCDICGANVFTVNMGPHKEWHGRMMG